MPDADAGRLEAKAEIIFPFSLDLCAYRPYYVRIGNPPAKQSIQSNIMKSIITKYLPATNTKGARIKASVSDFKAVTLPWDFSRDTKANHERAALEICRVNDLKKDEMSPVIDGNTGYSFAR